MTLEPETIEGLLENADLTLDHQFAAHLWELERRLLGQGMDADDFDVPMTEAASSQTKSARVACGGFALRPPTFGNAEGTT